MAAHTRGLNPKPSSNLWNSFNRTSRGGSLCTYCGGTPAINVHLKVRFMQLQGNEWLAKRSDVFF